MRPRTWWLAATMTALAPALAGGCGSSSPTGSGGTPYDTLPVSLATVQSAIDYFAATGVDSVRPDCGTSPAIDCPAGTPGDPVPVSITQTWDSVFEVAPGQFGYSVRLQVVSLADIPITIPVIGDCSVAIDTRAGADSVIQLDGTAMFTSIPAGGPIDAIELPAPTVSLLAAEDVTINGGSTCATASLGLSFFVGMIQAALAPPTLYLCGAPGPDLFEVCAPPVAAAPGAAAARRRRSA